MAYDGADGYRVTCDSIAHAFRPRVLLTNEQWAAANFTLSGKSSQERGRWQGDRVPFLLGVLAALDDSHPAELVVFVGSSQVAKSTCGLIWIGRTIDQAPVPMLALFPTEKDARKWTRGRLNPMIASTPALRRLMPPNKRSEESNTLAEKHYPDGVLYTGSANIPTDVASVSVAKVLLDERNRMPKEIPGEGDPGDLAKRRMAAFSRRKAFEASTPTDEDEEGSGIWTDFLDSTMDRYHVPCPHCGEFQHLTFDNLKWPEGEPERAVYICRESGCVIQEHHKTGMLAAGEWRAEHPEREATNKGFQINGLYTPLGLGDTWAKHAAEWDAARGKPKKLRVFYNTRRGEPFKGEKVRVEWESLYARREPYMLRTIPAGVLILTGSADVQHDRIEAQILGHGRDGRCVVIDYIVLEGEPVRPEVWKKLDDYLASELLNSYGKTLRLSCALVDSGAWQHEVLNYTRDKRSRNIYASKGSSVASREPIKRPSLVDVRSNGQLLKRGAEQYQIGVSVLKHSLYARLRSDAAALPGDRLVRFSEELPAEYFRQLTAESFEPGKGWHKTYERNEALDLFVLGLAAAMHHSTQVHRMRELDWQRLEALYESGAPVPKQELGTAPVAKKGGGFLPTVATGGGIGQ